MIVVNGGIPDPVQKALRVRKSNWNKKMVTPFIDNLIQLKMLMNGKPSKFHKERNSIINPLPADPATILGLLADDFQKIVSEGNAIIKDQINYSQNRRKKSPKQMELPTPNTPTNKPNPNQLNLPGITSSILEMNRINIQASNFLTRFLAGLKGPRFGESPAAIKRRYRGSLLKQANEIYKLCSNFQASVVRLDISKLFSKHDEEGLYEATETLMDIESKFTFMENGIKLLHKDMLRASPTEMAITPPTEGESSEGKPRSNTSVEDSENTANLTVKAADEIVTEWNQVSSSILQIKPELRNEMLVLVRGYMDLSEGDQAKSLAATRVYMTYKKILASLNAIENTHAKSLTEYLFMPKTGKNAAEAYALEVMASKGLAKWKGKGLRSLLSKKTSANRLSAYRSAVDLRKGLNKLMNILEKDFDAETLLTAVNDNVREPLFKIGEAIDSMLDSVKLDIENLSYKDPKKEEKRTKFLRLIERRKMTQMTKRLVPSNYGLLTHQLAQPTRIKSPETTPVSPPVKP